MKINRYEDMNLQELDVMKEIGSIGTGHAATALSQLLQKEVRITIPQVQILGYNGAVKRIGDEEEIVGATLVQMQFWKNCWIRTTTNLPRWIPWPFPHWQR